MAERQREPGRDRGEKEEKTAEMRKKRRKVKEDRKIENIYARTNLLP